MSTDLGPLPQKRLQRGEKVIFGALDWGLGHATRSIPLLRYIQQKGGQVSVAATGPTAELLKNELPEAEFLDLPGYGITYPGEGKSFRNHLLLQLPKIRRARTKHREAATFLNRRFDRDLNVVLKRFELLMSDERGIRNAIAAAHHRASKER